MSDARWNGLDLRLLEAPHHFVGRDPGRKIDVADREPEQIIADRSADVAGETVVGVQRGNTALLNQIDQVLADRHREIEALLNSYRVPRANP